MKWAGCLDQPVKAAETTFMKVPGTEQVVFLVVVDIIIFNL